MLSRCCKGVAFMLLAVSASAGAEVVIEEAWLRAVPPVSSSMAGYFSVTNTGSEAVSLTGAETDIAGHVMLHGVMETKEGQRRMHHLDAVTVAPGATETFAPAARHLMLMKLDHVPAPGETVEICLTRDHGKAVCGIFPVRHTAPPKDD